MDWTEELLKQLTWHWDSQLRPRLVGLTDAEYFWEPVPRMWNLRPRAESRTRMAAGAGDHLMDFERTIVTPGQVSPRPETPTSVPLEPVTTIAWRVGHLLVGIFGDRNARHFGGEPVAYPTFDYPVRAQEALAQLDAGEARWRTGVAALTAADLEKPCGEPGFEQDPMAALVLHIHREIIHHGAEICLLRDLYAARGEGLDAGW